MRVETRKGEGNVNRKPTEKQGQYLAFIYYYIKINGRPPAKRTSNATFARRHRRSTR